MSWASRVDAYVEGGFGRDRGGYCERHDVWHREDDPCPVCYERWEVAQQLKERRKIERARQVA